jgi:hypothetical protein
VGIAWPQSDVTDRIPAIALAATILGFFEGAWPSPAWARWENRILFSVATLGVMLGPAAAITETLGTRETNLWLLGLGAGILISWVSLDAIAARITGVALAVPLLVATGGASAVLVLAHSIVLGQLGGGLAAVLGAAWLVSWWGSPLNLARGGVTVLVLVVAALVLEGHIYANLPASGAVLIAAAPLTLWVTRIGFIRRRAPWVVALVGAIAVLIPLGVAAGRLLATSEPSYGE